jgi:hypothetical protein
MTPVVSRDAFKDALRELLRVEPGLYAESVQLFYREHAPYEPRKGPSRCRRWVFLLRISLDPRSISPSLIAPRGC